MHVVVSTPLSDSASCGSVVRHSSELTAQLVRAHLSKTPDTYFWIAVDFTQDEGTGGGAREISQTFCRNQLDTPQLTSTGSQTSEPLPADQDA